MANALQWYGRIIQEKTWEAKLSNLSRSRYVNQDISIVYSWKKQSRGKDRTRALKKG